MGRLPNLEHRPLAVRQAAPPVEWLGVPALSSLPRKIHTTLYREQHRLAGTCEPMGSHQSPARPVDAAEGGPSTAGVTWLAQDFALDCPRNLEIVLVASRPIATGPERTADTTKPYSIFHPRNIASYGDIKDATFSPL